MSKLIELDQKYVWHPFTQHQIERPPLQIVQGYGSTLVDVNGRKYLDCNSSWWTILHEHQHPYLKQALIEQFDELDHVLFAGVTHPKAVELAYRLAKFTPNELTRTFFSDNGSTAIEVAIKMVYQYFHNQNKPKKKILALEGAYHGDTFGAMSVSSRGNFNKPFEHLFFTVDYLPFPFNTEIEEKNFHLTEKLFESGEFAAIIVEPIVQGAAGMRMYRPEFLEKWVQIAKKYDVLVVFDEVMTAWGRTGKLFAMNYINSTPDIVCFSKGVTGGVLPLGITHTSEKIYQGFLSDNKEQALLHGHSFTANPLACSLACANFDLIEQADFYDQIDRISKSHHQFYNEIRGHELLKEVRQTGTIIAFELYDAEKNGYFSNIKEKIITQFIELSCLIRPLGNTFFLNPPSNTSNEELQQMYESVRIFLNDWKK
ncbi:MAG: adenosylmethionine--8-amino-7-oxononanoate transaminase [Flavobacteriia bacterium]|nr:adenosylmethionine--8-amino-7-oxononanoate transaminase [Flavobacteriia bacterium]